MHPISPMTCTAFEGTRRIAAGDLAHVALQTKKVVDRAGPEAKPVLVFNDATGEQIEIDFRGSADDVLKRVQDRARTTPRGNDAPDAVDSPNDSADDLSGGPPALSAAPSPGPA